MRLARDKEVTLSFPGSRKGSRTCIARSAQLKLARVPSQAGERSRESAGGKSGLPVGRDREVARASISAASPSNSSA